MEIGDYLESIRPVVDMKHGEEREHKGLKVVAVTGCDCESCVFNSACDERSRRHLIYPTFGECNAPDREDDTDVVFKKVEVML